MTRKSVALTLIASLFAAGPLLGEPDSTKGSTKRSSTERKAASPARKAAPVSRVLTVRDIPIFTYQPGPTRVIDVRTLRDEGLARLYINEQGRVTSVKIMRSSGHPEYDAEAVYAFRRWRTRPGPPREIDLPLTSVTTGKKAPVRVPLVEGSLTIG